MAFCKDCIFWSESYRGTDGRMGQCSNILIPPLIEKDVINKEYNYDENLVLHVNEFFGCIYYRKSTLVSTNIEINRNSTCMICKHTGDFLDSCPNCGSQFIKIQ